ncbi:MAG: hypothetical protein SOR56_08805 [Oscillospiraceae bacterium]|nr:hypothetical protein [Oscillospiraceae bacterium]
MNKKLNELKNWAHDSLWRTMLVAIPLGTVYMAIFFLFWAGLHLAFPESIRSVAEADWIFEWILFVVIAVGLVSTPTREKKNKK